ncbi:MAG TPA: D-alanyl-D-alanine carboxypeptidase [Chroococcidiopsis sp.]
MEFFSSILSLLINQESVTRLKAADLEHWMEGAAQIVLASLLTPERAPDPLAESSVAEHVAAVGAAGMDASVQGVWLQAGNQIVAEHQGTVPLSAASLTKIPTTLAALATWPADHRFETGLSMTGTIANGVLQGDLVVQAGGDPFFVWEEAIALANTLANLGITRVAGNLVVSDRFAMNFQTDPAIAGALLKQGMNADLWNSEAATQYQTLPAGTPRPQLVIDGSVQVQSDAAISALGAKPILRHQSLALVDVLHAMNTYSNNVMADMMADNVGGAQVVAQKAAALANVPSDEIQLINGSGLGNANKISPRAVVAMLRAIQGRVNASGLNVADVFPVIGRDRGTLGGRSLPPGAAVKTGTLNDVSSLAGVFPTRDRGLVWFAVINVGTADLKLLHRQQDLLIDRLTEQWGDTPLPELAPGDRTDSRRLGEPRRNQPI